MLVRKRKRCGFTHPLGVGHRADLPCDPVERDRVMGLRALAEMEKAMTRPGGPTRPAPSRPSPPRPRVLRFAAVLVLVALAGCSSSVEAKETDTDDSARVIRVESPDGRTVFCVLWDGSREGGLDCDWLNAR